MKVSKEILSPRLNKKKYTCSDLVNFLKIREDSINKINKNEEINFFKKEFYSFKETFAEKSLSYIYKGCIKHKITPGIYKKKEYRGESIVEKKEELLMYCETMGPIIKILNLSSLTELEAKDIENICSWCPNIEVLWLSYMNNNNLKNCLQYLEKLKNLKELELIFWNNDMDIEVISKLKNLRILNLCGADLTNQDFELLGNLENLERLLLVKCRKITREGLISFLQKPLKEIKYINLDYTRFYEEDCENLKNDPLFIKKYPNLEIVSCKRFRG